MAVDAAKRGLPLASTSHRTEGTTTLVAFGLPVARVLAAGVVWPAFGEFVTPVEDRGALRFPHTVNSPQRPCGVASVHDLILTSLTQWTDLV